MIRRKNHPFSSYFLKKLQNVLSYNTFWSNMIEILKGHLYPKNST